MMKIINKIITFLRRKFNKNIKLIEMQKINNSKNKEEFFESIIVIDNSKINELQKQLESGDIKEENLTKDQAEEIIELYKDQIKELDRKIYLKTIQLKQIKNNKQ